MEIPRIMRISNRFLPSELVREAPLNLHFTQQNNDQIRIENVSLLNKEMRLLGIFRHNRKMEIPISN